jgi:hypothetical protein
MTTLRATTLLACLALVAACSNGSASVGTAGLSEPQVRALVETVEASIYTDQERQVLDPALSDDFKVTFRAPGEADVVMDKQEYAQDADIEDVDYQSRVGDVHVVDGGAKATAEVAVTEKYDADGSHIEESSRQVYTIELRDGQPRIVALASDSTSLSIDGKKQY